MPKFFSTLSVLSLLFLFSAATLAQQVFIKNQPFKGQSFKEGGIIWVELVPLEEALNFKTSTQAEGVIASGQLLRTLKKGDRVFVPLAQVAAILKATIRENASMGIIDFYQGIKDVQDEDLEELATPDTKKQPANLVQTAGFAFTLPKDMQISRDPRIIKAFLGVSGKPLGTPHITYDALIFHKGDKDYSQGAGVLSWSADDIPKAFESESAIAGYLHETMLGFIAKLGLTNISGPEPLRNQEQDFLLAGGQSTSPPYSLTMILLRIDYKRKRFYTVVCGNIPHSNDELVGGFIELLKSIKTR